MNKEETSEHHCFKTSKIYTISASDGVKHHAKILYDSRAEHRAFADIAKECNIKILNVRDRKNHGNK